MTVVSIIHATVVSARYGCRVYGLSKSGVTPGGGGKPGSFADAIWGEDWVD